MLVLTRRIDESIILTLPNGNTIIVMVTDVIDNKVRLGNDAPESVNILREELEIDE